MVKPFHVLCVLGSFLGIACSTAFAGNTQDKEEVWQGQGMSYTPDGQELEKFQVEVILTKKEGIIHSEATVTKVGGSKKVISQDITPTKTNAFKVESNLGQGGGACYGEGLCESYMADAAGKAFATTIVHDTKTTRRYLTTELEQGKAVKVIRQKLMLRQ